MSNSGWNAPGASLTPGVTGLGDAASAWAIPGQGVWELQTTLHGLKAGRPHNFVVDVTMDAVVFPTNVTSAYAVVGYSEQGPDYGVPLSIFSNDWLTLQVAATQTADSSADYTLTVTTDAACTVWLRNARTQEYLPVMVLKDEDFASPPDVLFDGLQQVNRQLVHGAGAGLSGAAVRGEAPLPPYPEAAPWPALTDEQAQYGLLEDVMQQQTIPDELTANRAAVSRYLLLFRAPRLITGGVLATSAAFADAFNITDLLPGNYVYVQLDRYCIPVGAYFRISHVAVSYTGGSEQITLTLIPPRDL
jgi:hypothetical protein